ncbi:MAG: cytochrome c biogenesis protein CcsA [Bacteroidota bacterium]
MKKFYDFLFSTPLMAVVITAFAVAMAAATFIENDYGTQASKAIVYNSWWFELLLYLLTISFLGNIFKYRLYRKKKWPILLFHIAFVVTLTGAFVTRYFGYEGTMPIREGAVSNTILSNSTYFQVNVDDGKEYKEFEREVLLGSLNSKDFNLHEDFHKVPFVIKYIGYVPESKSLDLDIISGEQIERISINLEQGDDSIQEKISLNGLNFSIKFGPKEIQLPFSVKLNDFQLDRYPGSNSPSSFASEVTVIDKEYNFDYRIFMNHVLDYKGYRFFQSNYHQDEKGSILSVNHDYWGTLITYVGYFLMGIGMFFTLFWKGTRFSYLSEKLKNASKNKFPVILLFFIISSATWAQENQKADINKYTVSKSHADKFGKLLIQDNQGRIKPVNTYALEVLRKVYKKDTYKNLTSEQVLLSAQLDPGIWGREPIIHIKPTALGVIMSKKLSVKEGQTSIADFYKGGKYLLIDDVNAAHRKKNINRTATDKEIINLDERVNVWWNVLNGNLLNVYPKPGDKNNKWYTGINKKAFVEQDTMILSMHRVYMGSLYNAIKTNDYTEADNYLGIIVNYQRKISSDIVPSTRKVELEIKYNRWDIFKNLLFYYMIIGLIFIILAFVDLFKPSSKIVRYLLKVFTFLSILGMVMHVIGLGLRWYISGHEPWSNGYEAVVFVAFITILAGLIFSYNKSKFSLASTVLFASFLLGIAHGSMMSPEITNLVPVLKSYWLMIHVAVITASYGFLGLGALLGFVVLLLYILRTPNNAARFNKTINELTYINEMTLTVGLFTLTIGTFLGGVWANESWGRYWSWDPKEVWSLISMMVYVFVLHMRFIPGLRGKFIFNMMSMFSISTLIMTFFGVNFYLSGMHSYASGDPVPIPNWIYLAVLFFVVFSVVSFRRHKVFIIEK